MLVDVDQGRLAAPVPRHPGQHGVERPGPGRVVLAERGAVGRLLGRVDVGHGEQDHLGPAGEKMLMAVFSSAARWASHTGSPTWTHWPL